MYIIKILKKGQASELVSDRYGHTILAGKFYFCRNYLKLVRSRNILQKHFELINLNVLILLEEVL